MLWAIEIRLVKRESTACCQLKWHFCREDHLNASKVFVTYQTTLRTARASFLEPARSHGSW
jgi:hypothetical protein